MPAVIIGKTGVAQALPPSENDLKSNIQVL